MLCNKNNIRKIKINIQLYLLIYKIKKKNILKNQIWKVH